MFSQVFVILSLSRGGSVTPNASWDRSHGQGEVLSGGREGGVDNNTSLLDNTSLLPPDNTSLPPPGQHLPPPGQYHLPPWTTPSPPTTCPLPWTTPPPGTMCRWAVRILLECILVRKNKLTTWKNENSCNVPPFSDP